MIPKYGFSKKTAELSTEFTGQRETLVCPNCGGKYLHQTSLAVAGKDRDDLRISFECEGCFSYPVLGVSQKDGSTILGWLEV